MDLDLYKKIYDIIDDGFNFKPDIQKYRIVNSINLKNFISSVSDEQLEHLLIDYRRIVHPKTFHNPLFIEMSNHQLYEGMMHTRPADETIEYISNYFLLQKEQILHIKQSQLNDAILIFIPNYMFDENKELLNRAMTLCGWFLSNTDKDNNWYKLQYEPLHQFNIADDIFKTEQVLYHATPVYTLKKIKYLGLSPRSKNSEFDYPNRIYFTLGSAGIKFAEKVGKVICSKNKSKGNNGQYAILTIDVKKLQKSISFYEDKNCPNSIFTNDNIRAETITDITYINY